MTEISTSKSFKLEIVTPFELVFSGMVNYVRAPGELGSFGVMDRHTPFIAALSIGEIKVQIGKQVQYYATSGGFVEVLPDSVTILAETADEAQKIDSARAKNAMTRAKERLVKYNPDIDTDRAQLSLQRAANRLRIIEKAKSKKE